MQSTAIPCSANFIVVDNPANPPPTTSTRCLLIPQLSNTKQGFLAKALRRKKPRSPGWKVFQIFFAPLRLGESH
jgi:hypothetical protein